MLDNYKPLLSIVIPTKNRYTTLFSVVDMLLSFGLNDDIEIVIQDNSDDNQEALKFIKDRVEFYNLQYFHETTPLSVIENSDEAVLNSKGEYVCFIGDDDGVMPNIVNVVKWMKANDMKVLKSIKPQYYWPNQKSNFLSNNVSGILKTFRQYKDRIRILKTDESLVKTLQKGGVTMEDLPCLYHGIVKKEVLDVIYQKTNTFFPGPSPDMANAIALTKVVDTYAFADFPVVISGKSSKSTGGAGVLHQHISTIEEVSHLPKNTAKYWSKQIPKFWTGPTIWSESVVKSLQAMGDDESISKINFKYLYAHLFVFNVKHKQQIFSNFEVSKDFKFYQYKFKIFLNRVVFFVKNRLGLLYRQYNGVKNIKNAIQIIEKQITSLEVIKNVKK